MRIFTSFTSELVIPVKQDHYLSDLESFVLAHRLGDVLELTEDQRLAIRNTLSLGHPFVFDGTPADSRAVQAVIDLVQAAIDGQPPVYDGATRKRAPLFIANLNSGRNVLVRVRLTKQADE